MAHAFQCGDQLVKWPVRILVALLTFVFVALPLLVWGALHSDRVTQSLLPHLPGIRVWEPKGALLGDFSARRVEINLPRGSLLSLDDAQWRGLRVYWDPRAQWHLGIHANQLSARLVKLNWVPNPQPAPTTDPYDLRLPLTISIDRVMAQRGESALWGPWALQNLDGRLDLGQLRHRADITQLVYGPWTLKGRGQVRTQKSLLGDLDVSAAGTYASQGVNLPLHAHVTAHGKLTALSVSAQAQVGGAQRQQALDAQAVLKLWAPWPVPSLHVKAKHFDLSALSAGLPKTALTGAIDWDAKGPDLQAQANVSNAQAGNWQAGQLPVRLLTGRVTLPGAAQAASLSAMLASGQVHVLAGLPGTIKSQLVLDGSWDGSTSQSVKWPNRLVLQLTEANLQALDGRAPALTLSGQASAMAEGVLPSSPGWMNVPWTLASELSGVYQMPNKAGRQQQTVEAELRGSWQAGAVKVDTLSLRADTAQALLKGSAAYRPPSSSADRWFWQTKAQLQVKDFDPQVWLPWPQAWTGPNRLHGQLDVDANSSWVGQAALRLNASTLAGTPIQGQAGWQFAPGAQQADLSLDLVAAGNHAQMQGRVPWRLGPDGLPRVKGAQDWQLNVSAPGLRSLQALFSGLGVHALNGRVDGQAQFQGQWPAFNSQGQLKAQQLQWQLEGQTASHLTSANAHWTVQTRNWDAPVELQASVVGLQLPYVQLDQAQCSVVGSALNHQASLSAQGRALKAGKTDANKQTMPLMVMSASASGGLLSSGGRVAGWKGRVQDLNWRTESQPQHVWLKSNPFDVAWRHEVERDQVSVSPVGLNIAGVAMTLQEFDWLSGDQGLVQLRTWLKVDPLLVPAWLKQWQPQVGWGGDLTVGGEVRLMHSPAQPWQLQAHVSKLAGDLSLSEPSIEGNSVQKLGIDVASIKLAASQGVWTLTQVFEGSVLGRLSGRQSVSVADPKQLPSGVDVLSGELDLQIGSLRPWAAWVPAGWRLHGQVNGRADVAGTLASPQYKGVINGQNLQLAHALMGVNLTEGQLQLDLQGDHAHLANLTAKGGAQGGFIKVTGDAVLGSAPQASLEVQAERFALLQRIDRRLVISGQAKALLTEADIQFNGKVGVDEGLFDFSRSDAPTVGDDVNVLNGPGKTIDDEDESSSTAGKRKMTAAVDIDLGDHLHLRGRGLDTDLTGRLKFTTPNNRPSLQGSVKAVRGTYVAYGQKLNIDRGTIAFTGPIENPRLDILAMRKQSPTAASSDVKVGVQIAGTAQDPRISLYSDPSMSETDKLSWLILGRGPNGLGGADIGLLQSAAVALLSGEGPSTTDNIISTLGLDELSVHQSDGTVRDTVVNVGKQISRYWYVGYERNLNATSGNWQLIYRLAQRFTLRAQTGSDNAVDLIWAWRWD